MRAISQKIKAITRNIDMLAQEEQFVREKLESTSGFKGTSSEIQNELIECATLVVKETIQKELDLAEFVSVQEMKH
ncbi:hypothetical protein ANN_26412 [Periplaneta americana]|uniref:Uncharacterized protein n=1 Tax=Periplaneta americana TaxID=6978 RepID=A0ABQ8RY36_PERAM|nr:hypothetical protein ANN_26412 [Periplaneta americana]